MTQFEPAIDVACTPGEPPARDGRLEDDLRTFIAVGADRYLRQFSAWAETVAHEPANSASRMALSWHWPAFLATVPWLFYRKMYSGGILVVALPILLNYIRPGAIFFGSSLLIALLAGLYARAWYLDHALNCIRKAHQRGLSGTERRRYLQRAGGVSVAGAVFGILIEIVLIATAIAGLIG